VLPAKTLSEIVHDLQMQKKPLYGSADFKAHEFEINERQPIEAVSGLTHNRRQLWGKFSSIRQYRRTMERQASKASPDPQSSASLFVMLVDVNERCGCGESLGLWRKKVLMVQKPWVARL
jgi:hypothetical protein